MGSTGPEIQCCVASSAPDRRWLYYHLPGLTLLMMFLRKAWPQVCCVAHLAPACALSHTLPGGGCHCLKGQSS